MSLSIGTTQHYPSQVVRTTTTVETVPARHLNLGDALRNTAIGGALGGALGGFLLLAKASLPIIGRVKNLSGLVRLAGAGGAIGLATAVLPVVAPSIRRRPLLKAALTGASVGAAAGAILPLVPAVGGAVVGAAIGAGIHVVHRHARRWNSGWYGYPPIAVMPPGPGFYPIPSTPMWSGPMTPYGSVSPFGASPYESPFPSRYGAFPSPYLLPFQRQMTGAPIPRVAIGAPGVIPTAPGVPVPVNTVPPVVHKARRRARRKARRRAIRHRVQARTTARLAAAQTPQVAQPAVPTAAAMVQPGMIAPWTMQPQALLGVGQPAF